MTLQSTNTELPGLDQILQDLLDEKKKFDEKLSKNSVIADDASQENVTADILATIPQLDSVKADSDDSLSANLQILYTSKGFRYFDPGNLESSWDSVAHNPNSRSGPKCSKLSYTQFISLLENGRLNWKQWERPSALSSATTLQGFLWKLMSVHSSPNIVAQSQATLLKFLRQLRHKYIPSIEELFGILINSGITSTDSNCCPLPHLYEKGQRQLSSIPSRQSQRGSRDITKRNLTILRNIKTIIQTLASVVSTCSHRNLPDTYLSHLALICLWLACDKQILSKAKGVLTKCLNECLRRISSEAWPERLSYLTREIVSLGKSPKRIHHLTDFLLQIPRGLQLKSSVSFCALHVCRGEQYDHSLDISAERVLLFLKSQDLHKLKDAGLLHELLLLADKSLDMVPTIKQETAEDLVKFFEALDNSIMRDALYSESDRAVCHLLLFIPRKIQKSKEPLQNNFIFKSSRQSCS